MGRILLVDDSPKFLESMEMMLDSLGHECDTSKNLADAWTKLQNESFDLVFLDLTLPDGSGLDIIPGIVGLDCSPALLVLTGMSDSEVVDRALRAGAWDYLLKPIQIEQLEPLVERTIRSHHAKSLGVHKKNIDRRRIVGNSSAIRKPLEQVAMAANNDGSVLITGETGTGKELFAKAVHRNSPRSKGPFIVMDCTNLPPTLAESLLFGHEKGSFTGAQEAREGLFKQAHGGTIFMDEIGDLSPGLQKSLLRVLQEKRFRPLSSRREVSSDFRLIAATNRDLAGMLPEGQFRQDLYYRIKTIELRLPSLRERPEDIPKLFDYYSKRICKSLGMSPKKACPEFLDALRRYQWPGNVREFINALYNAMNKATFEDTLGPHHLPLEVRSYLAKQRLPGDGEKADEAWAAETWLSESGELLPLKEVRARMVDELEASYLQRLRSLCGGSIGRACTISGVRKARLYELLQKHSINLRSDAKS